MTYLVNDCRCSHYVDLLFAGSIQEVLKVSNEANAYISRERRRIKYIFEGNPWLIINCSVDMRGCNHEPHMV